MRILTDANFRRILSINFDFTLDIPFIRLFFENQLLHSKISVESIESYLSLYFEHCDLHSFFSKITNPYNFSYYDDLFMRIAKYDPDFLVSTPIADACIRFSLIDTSLFILREYPSNSRYFLAVYHYWLKPENAKSLMQLSESISSDPIVFRILFYFVSQFRFYDRSALSSFVKGPVLDAFRSVLSQAADSLSGLFPPNHSDHVIAYRDYIANYGQLLFQLEHYPLISKLYDAGFHLEICLVYSRYLRSGPFDEIYLKPISDNEIDLPPLCRVVLIRRIVELFSVGSINHSDGSQPPRDPQSPGDSQSSSSEGAKSLDELLPLFQ